MQVGERHHRHHVVYPPTHLSVLEDEQPGVVLGPGRKADMVHSIPILTHSKVEPYMRKRQHSQETFVEVGNDIIIAS